MKSGHHTPTPRPLSAGISEFSPLNASHSTVDGCASPPAEMCGTHHLHAAMTTIRARFPSPAILTSITIWDTAPPPLPAGALANVSISVGRNATTTYCALLDPPPPSSDPASDPTWMPGFARKALLSGCSTPATFATIHIPRLATTDGPPAAIAVKICISRLDATAALRDGTLWLQEAPQPPPP